jgi:dipeptide transport system permease protein
MARFPATVELSLVAMGFALLLGLPAGILAAVKRNTVWDYSVMGASLTGYSMPIFWWGLLLILTFSVGLGWTPVSGRWRSSTTSRGDRLHADRLAALGRQGRVPQRLLAPDPAGGRARHDPARGDRADDALVDARGAARGLRAHRPRQGRRAAARRRGPRPAQRPDPGGDDDRPAGRHACSPGAILTETIFAWPGIGKWLVEAIHRRDYAAVQGGILMTATIIIGVNLIVDVLYGVINPRIRHA